MHFLIAGEERSSPLPTLNVSPFISNDISLLTTNSPNVDHLVAVGLFGLPSAALRKIARVSVWLSVYPDSCLLPSSARPHPCPLLQNVYHHIVIGLLSAIIRTFAVSSLIFLIVCCRCTRMCCSEPQPARIRPLNRCDPIYLPLQMPPCRASMSYGQQGPSLSTGSNHFVCPLRKRSQCAPMSHSPQGYALSTGVIQSICSLPMQSCCVPMSYS